MNKMYVKEFKENVLVGKFENLIAINIINEQGENVFYTLTKKVKDEIEEMFKKINKQSNIFKKNKKEYVFGVYAKEFNLIGFFSSVLYKLKEDKINYELIEEEDNLKIVLKELNTIIDFKNINNEDLMIGYEYADCLVFDLNTLEKEKSELVLKIITARNRMNKYNKEDNIITIS